MSFKNSFAAFKEMYKDYDFDKLFNTIPKLTPGKYLSSWAVGDTFKMDGEPGNVFEILGIDPMTDAIIAKQTGSGLHPEFILTHAEFLAKATYIHKSKQMYQNKPCECGADKTWGLRDATDLHSSWCPKYNRS